MDTFNMTLFKLRINWLSALAAIVFMTGCAEGSLGEFIDMGEYTETGTTSDSSSETETGTGTDTDADTDTETETDTGTGRDTDSDADTGTETDTGSDTGTETDTGSDTGTETDTVSDTGTETDTGSDTETGGGEVKYEIEAAALTGDWMTRDFGGILQNSGGAACWTGVDMNKMTSADLWYSNGENAGDQVDLTFNGTTIGTFTIQYCYGTDPWDGNCSTPLTITIADQGATGELCIKGVTGGTGSYLAAIDFIEIY